MTSLRTFNEHTIRPVRSLAGRWDFVIESERADSEPLPAYYNRTIYVPSAWETLPGLENYRGRAWFRTYIDTFGSEAVRLAFGGVSHTADVYIDGLPPACGRTERGHHYDAFTPWSVLFTDLPSGRHELVVAVDNSFGEHSALHIENDYYTYGGITRPIEMQLVPDVFIDKLFLTPIQTDAGWSLDVRVRVKNLSEQKQTRRVTIRLENTEYHIGEIEVDAPRERQSPDWQATAETHIVLKDLEVLPWTSETPNLYRVKAVLYDDRGPVDDFADRVGFRSVCTDGKKILLNGRPLHLAGYNRHEDHPQFGNAIPVEAMVTDLAILRDLGCNFVRTSHYPNDQRFLDLCDEMGFYVWEESHARTVDFSHPKFAEQIDTSTVEMVEAHYNHSSIIMWGCLNECESNTEAGKEHYKRVLGIIKKLDASRPTTFASDRHQNDLCFGLADIVSINVYTGWYKGTMDDIGPWLEDFLTWLHSPDSHGGEGKPVIISEFGAAGLYGNRQRTRGKWSEEGQADLLRESLRIYLNHPDVAGAAIWQFCDVRITRNWQHWVARPRLMNNKGTVDEYRRPKLCYDVVKEQIFQSRNAEHEK